MAESLDVIGTVEPVNEATASFQVGGQVASVNVTVGEQVAAGQVLASLDPTALNESVSSAQSTLESDNGKLTEDEDSQTSGATTTSATSVQLDPTATSLLDNLSVCGGGTSGSGGSTTSASTVVTVDQAALVTHWAASSADHQQEACRSLPGKSRLPPISFFGADIDHDVHHVPDVHRGRLHDSLRTGLE